jgi:hypothetical protein
LKYFRVEIPSHGRGRRFNPYSAHQQIKYLATPPKAPHRKPHRKRGIHCAVNIAPATKKAPPGPSRAALGFCGRVASDGRARSSLPHDSRPRNGSLGLVIEAFAFRHGLDLQSLVGRHPNIGQPRNRQTIILRPTGERAACGGLDMGFRTAGSGATIKMRISHPDCRPTNRQS